MTSSFLKRTESCMLSLGFLSALTSVGLSVYTSAYNTVLISPEAIRAYAIRREIDQTLATYGVLQGMPLDHFSNLQQEYQSIDQNPEHHRGLEVLLLRKNLHDYSAITGASGLLFILLGGLLQRKRLSRESFRRDIEPFLRRSPAHYIPDVDTFDPADTSDVLESDDLPKGPLAPIHPLRRRNV